MIPLYDMTLLYLSALHTYIHTYIYNLPNQKPNLKKGLTCSVGLELQYLKTLLIVQIRIFSAFGGKNCNSPRWLPLTWHVGDCEAQYSCKSGPLCVNSLQKSISTMCRVTRGHWVMMQYLCCRHCNYCTCDVTWRIDAFRVCMCCSLSIKIRIRFGNFQACGLCGEDLRSYSSRRWMAWQGWPHPFTLKGLAGKRNEIHLPITRWKAPTKSLPLIPTKPTNGTNVAFQMILSHQMDFFSLPSSSFSSLPPRLDPPYCVIHFPLFWVWTLSTEDPGINICQV